ncbi:MAG: glycosyltransferase [Clostridia bacterium]|nr:glycosyltransferase [Clostridia bacterium]
MENKKILVSVIVPVYNVKEYLEQCLDSIVNQTLKNIEIILVNDGSTDGSDAICEKYVASDSRMVLIHQKNAGLAAARQAGLNVAKGEYIGFVDSDDWLEPTMYEEMYEKATEHGADIVFCNVYRDEAKKEQIYFEPGFYDREGMEKTIFPRVLAAFDENKSECTLRWCNWLRIYRRALIEEHSIHFDPRFRRCQDLPFTFECTIHAQSYYYLGDRYLYHNRMNFESLSKGYTKNMWGLLKPWVEYLKNVVEQYTAYDFGEQMRLRAALTAFECADNETKPNNVRSLGERLSTIRQIMKESREICDWKTLDVSKMGRVYKLYATCFRLKMPLAFYLLSKKRYAARTKQYKELMKNK